jgi:POT family proton-dependent oligopeptide transporter
MVGIFFLYLTDTVGHSGRGMDNISATSIVGTYVALIYLTPLLEAWLQIEFFSFFECLLNSLMC